MLLLLLLIQSGAPTVGDTVWITRTVLVPRGGTVRPATWAPSGDVDVEALGPPRVTTRGDSVEIAYPAVGWLPGSHTVDLPGPLLLLAGGGVDSLPAQRVVLSIASVLPPGRSAAELAIQPPAETVTRGSRTLRPLGLLGLGSLLLLVPLQLWWRRRGRAAVPVAAVRPPVLPLARWADLGEMRVVLAAATATLRDAIARGAPSAERGVDVAQCVAAVRAERPDWPAGEIADVLAALEEARFTPDDFPDASGLAEWASGLASRLPERAA
jgi:hypothetical protein